jgi:hypothetical protein
MRAIAAALIWLALGGLVHAQDASQPSGAVAVSRPEPVVTWGGEVDVVSRYLWRGFSYSKGKVVWPTVWASAHGFTASLFTNYDPGYRPKLNEYDISVTYERTVGKLTVEGTCVRYAYFENDTSQATTELIGRVARSVGPGEIFTTHAFDVNRYRGSYYLEAGYAIERELDPKSTLTADASIVFWSKFIEKYAGASGKPVGPLSVNVAFTRQLAPHLRVRPHFTLSHIPDEEIRQLLDPPTATFGVAAVVDF